MNVFKDFIHLVSGFFFLQVPVPMVAPPLVKDMQDAAVQSEPLSASEEKAIQVPPSTAGWVVIVLLYGSHQE